MTNILELLGDVWAACCRSVAWTLSSVEEDPPVNVIPMPGPAHGPVPVIDLRVEPERRKAS